MEKGHRTPSSPSAILPAAPRPPAHLQDHNGLKSYYFDQYRELVLRDPGSPGLLPPATEDERLLAEGAYHVVLLVARGRPARRAAGHLRRRPPAQSWRMEKPASDAVKSRCARLSKMFKVGRVHRAGRRGDMRARKVSECRNDVRNAITRGKESGTVRSGSSGAPIRPQLGAVSRGHREKCPPAGLSSKSAQ